MNARCLRVEDGGSLLVQLIDGHSRHVVAGYSFGDCRVVSGDSTRHVVSWGATRTLPTSRPFSIVFQFKGCEIFSFKATEALEPG